MSTSDSLKNPIKQKIRNLLLIKRGGFKKSIQYCWLLFLAFLVIVPSYIFCVSIDLFGLFGGMPDTREIENPENDLSSELISADGVSLGRYFRYNRSQATYEQLSPDLVNTLLLSEDHRFYKHSGLDYEAYLRVLFGIVTFNAGAKGGGSTITQQLAKNLFTQNIDLGLDGKLVQWIPSRHLKRVIDKTKEWIISVKLERNFTKEEIITMYLNTAPFSSNAYGIRVAAETYFNKTPDSLNIQESAVLVGMLQAPTRFNPALNPENSLAKRNQVLGKLYKHNYLDILKFDSIRSLPIELQYKVENQNEGLATYFRSVIRNHLMDWCKENGYDLWQSGLKIYTTIDSRMQGYAEKALHERMKKLQKEFDLHWKGRNPWLDDDQKEIKGFLDSRIKQTDAYKNLVSRYGENHDSVRILLRLKKPMTVFSWDGDKDTLFSSMDSLNYYKRFLHSGFLAMDAQSGEIKAWVGGINHKYFKYDHVKQGTRQPGSTFKPFVYGTAMEAGYSPCLELIDNSPSFPLPGGGQWWPPNSDGTKGSGKKFNLRQAMARSINSITAQLIQKVSPENVVEFSRRVGISSALEAVPALCLGVNDVTLFEMVGAYGTFVNEGIFTEPIFITRIEDRNGNILASFIPNTKQAISEQTAYKMVYMFKGGVEEEGGTSVGLNRELKKDNELGGKTGTTNNASDGWYMGLTKNLVAGAWVGGDERSIHYDRWDLGQGSRTARPIWEAFMMSVYADQTLPYKKGFFKQPSRLDMNLDCDLYDQPDSLGQNTERWELPQ